LPQVLAELLEDRHCGFAVERAVFLTVRSPPRGVAGKVLQAAGVGLGPQMRFIAEQGEEKM